MGTAAREALPHWPHLMSVPMAADYLSISENTIRRDGPTPKRMGKRVLYDRLDLDRWADRLGDQPVADTDIEAESAEVERRFLERRNGSR